MSFGKNLEKFRKEKGLTQENLVNISGVSPMRPHRPAKKSCSPPLWIWLIIWSLPKQTIRCLKTPTLSITGTPCHRWDWLSFPGFTGIKLVLPGHQCKARRRVFNHNDQSTFCTMGRNIWQYNCSHSDRRPSCLQLRSPYPGGIKLSKKFVFSISMCWSKTSSRIQSTTAGTSSLICCKFQQKTEKA